MLQGILILFTFQLIGEILVEFLDIKIPSSIIGMILLLIFLILRKEYSNNLDYTVNSFLKYLPIFILPSAIGIINQFNAISSELTSISISLFLGTILTLIINGRIMEYLVTKRKMNDN